MSTGPSPPQRLSNVGLQAERTYLAWTRTGLAFATTAVLILRRALLGELWLLAFGLPAAIVSALILARAQWRYRMTVIDVQRGRSPAAPGLLTLIAAASTIVSIGGLAAILLT